MRLLLGAAHCISPVGNGVEEAFERMRKEGSALRALPDALGLGAERWLGRFADPMVHGNALRAAVACANGTLRQARIDPKDPRLALVISTTKGSLLALEAGDPGGSSIGPFSTAIAAELGISAVPWTVSNACASGVSAVILAADLVHAGEADHVLVIGVDVLSRFVLTGFGALQALSTGPCRPFDRDRNGITLGEAAASLLVTRDRAAIGTPLGEYLGGGLANDANHISGPSRTGEGLTRAIHAALAQAALAPTDVHALNAHGTGTAYNDAMEAHAFHRCGLQRVPVASFKGYFGHTLGAAGLVETVIALHALREGWHLRSEGTRTPDLPLPLDVVLEHRAAHGDTVLKTSSGFGGINAAVALRAWTA